MKTRNEKPSSLTWATLPSGRFSKWLALIIWVAIIAAAAPLASKLSGAESNNQSTWLPASAESTKALTIENQFLSPDEIPAVIVYYKPSGFSATDKRNILRAITNIQRTPHITAPVQGPLFSKDNEAAQIFVQADLGANYWANAASFNDTLQGAAQKDTPGINTHITGPLGTAAASSKAFSGIDTTLLFSALAVVTVLLLLTYRSPILWLLPVASAGVALAAAEAIIYLLAAHEGLVVNAQSAGILIVLVFGAATDYALLLISRYREELHHEADRHKAMAKALHRAAPAIIASAATVALSMICLYTATLNSTKGLGPVAAIGIAVGLLAIITLLPAMLVIFGRWLFWPLRPKYGTDSHVSSGLWARIGRAIAKHPRVTWVITTAVLLAMASGLLDLRSTALQGANAYRVTPDSVIGQNIIAAHFPAAGTSNPLIVVAHAAQTKAVEKAIQTTPGISAVAAPYQKGSEVLFEATLNNDPASQAAYNTVARVRAAVHEVPGASAMVTGESAVVVDTEAAANHDQKMIIPLVLGVVLIILALLMRSVVAPILLIATVILSFAAALGASSLIFDHIFKYGGTDSSFPLFVFIFLVALGIDYNIFLMTRVREESILHGTRQGMQRALAATGAVITSAGLVLAGTFSVLGTLPLTAFAEIGFAVAFGVLLDTIVVRSVLVSAITFDIGPLMWWPNHLEPKPAASAPNHPAMRYGIASDITPRRT